MTAALKRIFKKNLLFLLAVLVLFAGAKLMTARVARDSVMELSRIDNWAIELLGKDNGAIEEFADNISQEIGEDTETRREIANDFQKLNTSYVSRKKVQMLISFAHTLEGALPTSLPANYLELMDFYKKLETPAVINEQPLDIYFKLQQASIVPLIVLLLGAVFWGVHYESEIYKLTGTVKQGKAYNRTMKTTLTVLSMAVLAGNELFDLFCSGLLERPYLWKVSLQSYSAFSYTQMEMSLGMALVLCMVSKLLGVLILTQAAQRIAQWRRNLKDTVIFVIFMLLILLLAGAALQNTAFYPLLQVGSVDWKEIIKATVIFRPLNTAAFPIGIGIAAVTAILLMTIDVIAERKGELIR